MPLVLMINAAINNPSSRQLWSMPGWLPEQIGIVIDGNQVLCFEGEELRNRQANDTQGLIVYDLVGLVTEIDIAEQKKPHLVSFINVAVSNREATEKNDWHLFNDFLVTEVDRNEVFDFTQTWKQPCTIAYQVASARHGVDDSWKDNLDTTLLFYEWSSK
jgi:PAB-dependent poly(A)-specific ribonuclease subunit 2